MKDILQMDPAFKISINMPAEQINNKAYMTEFLSCAERNGICNNLCIEITEETNMNTLYCISENISMLKRHNISFALDDFSMGHTSLNYLKEKLFDYVKIDGNLVKDMMKNQRCEEIISSIIQLGEKLGFETIAEYVDEEKKKERLQKLGCDYYQGYLFSPAVPAKRLFQR